MWLPSSHCALTFCNEVLSRGPFHTSLTTDSFFCLLLSNIHLRALLCVFPFFFALIGREGGKGRGVKDGGKWQEVWLLTMQILSLWHPSQLHPSQPDANGCCRVAPFSPCPNHSTHPSPTSPTTPQPPPPLSQHGKRDLTQKWVETNDSNESLPPCQCLPSLPLPLQVAPNGSVFRLANCRSPSLNKYREGTLLPEPSCEPCML